MALANRNPCSARRRASALALSLAFLGALLSGSAAGCRSTPTTAATPGAVQGPDRLGDGRYELVVHGMSCPKCISNVELQLVRIEGVGSPTVDMKNGLVRIDVRGGRTPSKDAIAGAIADSGFTLVAIRGTDE